MTRQRRITTAVSLRRREAAARRTQDAIGPATEIARLQAHVAELLTTIRRLELANAGLQRRLDDAECEVDE
jgi:regulator of replication initiation timing